MAGGLLARGKQCPSKLAQLARAYEIFSGDRHLLRLQPQWRGIAILTAAQAVECIEPAAN